MIAGDLTKRPTLMESSRTVEHHHAEGAISVSLTQQALDISLTIDRIRSPKAGAIVLFAGTTRDNVDSSRVKSLTYTSYSELALKSLFAIARSTYIQYGLTGIALVHRLGPVPIGEESILIAVSAPHRQEAWRAGEHALEECKSRVEVWKLEEFEDGQGVWRANKDTCIGSSK